MAASDIAGDDLTQADMVHRLPPARVVDRAAYLVDAARGRSVAHVGFVDRGCWAYHERLDSWLHAHLDRVAGTERRPGRGRGRGGPGPRARASRPTPSTAATGPPWPPSPSSRARW